MSDDGEIDWHGPLIEVFASILEFNPAGIRSTSEYIAFPLYLLTLANTKRWPARCQELVLSITFSVS